MKLKRAMIIGNGLLLLAVGAGALAMKLSYRPLPAAPELAGVSLDLPPSAPVAEVLARQVTQNPKLDALNQDPALEAAKKDISAGRWPAEPAALAARLAELVDLQALHRALMAPGCWPISAPITDTSEPSASHRPMRAREAARALILDAVLKLAAGNSDRALSRLEELQRRLLAVARGCSHDVFTTVVVEATLDRLQMAWAFALALPETEGQPLQPRVWPRLAELRRRPSPWPTAMRREHANMMETYRAVVRVLDKKLIGRLSAWPWFDAEQTRRYIVQVGRRSVWLAQQPPGSGALAHPTPEERFFESRVRSDETIPLLQYNRDGLGIIFIELLLGRNRLTQWHLRKCRAAASHLRWAAELTQRGRTLAPGALNPPPQNPFTGKPFSSVILGPNAPSPCTPPGEADPQNTLDTPQLPEPPPPQ